MKISMLTASMIALLTLSACDKPTVVNVPGETVAVPGPAGPTGATGESGQTGQAGVQGETGGDTTVIVAPEATPETTPETPAQ